MRELPNALHAMGYFSQFILYKLVPLANGKSDKLPCDWRTGFVGDSQDPTIWTTAEHAIACAAHYGHGYGVAFVFTEKDPFWFLDIDNCLVDGQWSKLATDLCGYFAGAAIEISSSGKGLHLFGMGIIQPHSCKNTQYHLEFYHTGRFVALTGTGAMGNAATDCSKQVAWIVDNFFQPRNDGATGDWTTGPVPEWNGYTDDETLIKKAIAFKNQNQIFGNKASFEDVWTCNVQKLAAIWPSSKGDLFDRSNADLALANWLAYWTGKDCERMERIMRKSALVRDKWNRQDYMHWTITRAANDCTEVYKKPQKEPKTVPQEPVIVKEDGTIHDPNWPFENCIYIGATNRVYDKLNGIMYKEAAFDVEYGRRDYGLEIDGSRPASGAWEAFTQMKGRNPKIAYSSVFRPRLESGAIIIEDGIRKVNTYRHIETPREYGDVTPFLNHLAKVLPDATDREILLSYMAAVIQYKGVKFQWAPLLQGVEGNGKTLFSRCIAEAVGRQYTHCPDASKLAEKFNGWMVGKIFYMVEDIYVAGHRMEIIDKLKPMITGGDGLEIEAKGVDQQTVDICGNFMFNSNHRNAIPKTKNDRRICVFFTAQQNADDLIRDGMNGDYFPDLYNWLNKGGYAYVHEYLATYEIQDQYNPATHCQRAPKTSTTNDAIEEGRSDHEYLILDAVETGIPGFCGGFVSSMQLAKMGLNHRQMSNALSKLGYIKQPALVDGRVNRMVLPDGGKTRLYVKKDSISYNIAIAADVEALYEKTNNFSFDAAKLFTYSNKGRH